MITEIILTDIDSMDGAFFSTVRFSIVANGVTLAKLETEIPGPHDRGETLQATMRNRIHEIAELLDDWIRQGRRIGRA